MGDEFLAAAKEDTPASRDIRVGLPLLGLPLGRPEPSLVRIDRPLDNPAEKHACARDRVIGQLVDQLVKVGFGHDPNSDGASGPSGRTLCRASAIATSASILGVSSSSSITCP